MKESVLVYESISGGGMDAIAALHPALLAQGAAMRDALVADLAAMDGVEVSCVAGALAPLPPALAAATVTPPPAAEAAAFLNRAAQRYDRVWAIAPESGGRLAGLAAAVPPGRWVGCSAAAIRLASSKSATRTRLAAHGIPVPPGWRPGMPVPAHAGPWVVKPDDGAGAEDTLLHADFASACEDLRARLAAGIPSTLEAWVEGEALSLSLLCARRGSVLLAINRQDIGAAPGTPVTYAGVRVAAEPVDGPRGAVLAALADRVAAAIPGLAGYVGVDLVWHPRQGPVVIEVNPRLTCSYAGLSAALGRNVAARILHSLREEARDHALC